MRISITIATLTLIALISTSTKMNAQTRTVPINPSAVVQPTAETTASVVGNSIRNVGRIVTGTIENNAVVRTLNNLLGRTITTQTQPGFSPLPLPSAFQSTRYQNSFVPVTPISSTFGQSPTHIFPR